MSNEPVTQSLHEVLSDSYALYLKTQNYHWNVTGPHFRSLHLLFEEQYTDLAAAIDDIAERIRALGVRVEASLKVFDKEKHITKANENADAETMVKELVGDNNVIIQTLKHALEEAEKADDVVTVDMLTQRLTVHEKAAWMLESSL